MDEFHVDAKMSKLMKAASKFKIEIRPAFLTEEKEILFELYKTEVSFEASSSLANLLYGKENYTVYDTYEIVVFDGEKLIACGFFDIGSESAEGISSFYDPSYKKFSLGKFLIYSKMNYCKSIGLRYFYAGYFVPNYPAFDYKLELGKKSLQYFDYKSETWNPMQSFDNSNNPLEIMHFKLKQLSKSLSAIGVENYFFYYEFYNANLVPEFKDVNELLDYPMFLYLYELADNYLNPIIVVDIKSDNYKIIECGTFFKVDSPLVADKNYTSRILYSETTLASANTIEIIISEVKKIEQKSV